MFAITGLRGVLPAESRALAAYAIFFLNLGVAIAGLWTAQRAAWIVYLVASVAGMILISAATPITALWLLTYFL